ncbi:GNAT family N-acetyltransferase [Rhodovastum atsumiense]|uniref:GNAT family N-acetyltransferase n=1 Tax=Rhodovastum atsumiense TaxID=504468 RepID=UPI00139F2C41|nr:GNAT family N-acetyltransferase [Rhodovastum atsumiense]
MTELPDGIEALRAQAAAEGFRFIDRLVTEWHAGTNRFDRAGEGLLGAWEATGLVGVCGLNRDPYTDDAGVGRLRHLYVLASARRHGVAAALLAEILRYTEGTFHTVRLRTTPQAAGFYIRHGFVAVTGDAASHVRRLR